MAGVVRRLAPSEEMFAGGEVYIGYCIQVVGAVDLPALTVAFEATVRAHPILGVRIEAADSGHVFVETDTPPRVMVAEGDPDRLFVGATFDQRESVSALCVARAEETAGITLMIHHSVADTRHALAVVETLWSCYDAVVRGSVPEPRPHPYPAPVEELLAARGVRKLDLPHPPDPPSPPDPSVAPPVTADEYPVSVTTRCRLTREETTALVDLGHREGVTVHELVSAALLHTESELRELALSELLYLYSVDLRARVTPEIGPTEGTNVLGMASYLPAAEVGAGPLGLARGIGETFRAALSAGVVQQSPLHIGDPGAAPPPVPGIVVATNWGTLPTPAVPSGLRVRDFHSAIIAKPDRSGRRPRQPGAGTTIISTFAGRLSVEIHHPPEFTDLQRHRVDLLTATLRGLPRP